MPTNRIAIRNLRTETGWNQPRFQAGLAVALAITLATGTVVLAGCGKSKSAAAATPAQELKQAENDHMPVSSAPAAVAPLATPDGQVDMAELNRTMIRWLVGHRRPPASFEEFAATAGVPIPPPPEGKKYIIAKNMHVLLVDK